jgi:hypothetical protein
MEKDKIDIILHSVGFPEMHRNYFCASLGTEDFRLCKELAESGFMKIGAFGSAGRLYFHVTLSGLAAAGVDKPLKYEHDKLKVN